MPQPKDLRKNYEVWQFTPPPPSARRLFIHVEYPTTTHDISFTVYLDSIRDGIEMTESEARAITNALDELHNRLGIPKGETKC